MNTTLLVEAAVRSLLMAAAVWAGLRVLRVSHVVARKLAWLLVLVASAAMPLLMQMPLFRVGPSLELPSRAIASRLAWTAANAAPNPTTPMQFTMPKAETPGRAAAVTRGARKAAPASQGMRQNGDLSRDVPVNLALGAMPAGRHASTWTSQASAWRPSQFIVPVYLAVCGFLLLRLLVGLVLAARIWFRAERASPILEPRATVRISRDIDSPVTLASGIVLPTTHTGWHREKLRVVLAHERSHVRQGDFYIQALAQLYTAVFWFSPLGWLLKRELSELGEAISDRAALNEASSRPSYAEVLLEFAASTRRPLAGVAMARPSNISRRIERLLTDSSFQRAFASARRNALLALMLVPVAIVAATSLLHVQAAELPMKHIARPAARVAMSPRIVRAAQVAPVAPVAAVSPAAGPAPAAAPASGSQEAPAPAAIPAPAPMATPSPAVAPSAAPQAPREPAAANENENVEAPEPPEHDAPEAEDQARVTDDNHDSFAIVEDNDTTITGSSEMREKVERLRGKVNGNFILVEHNGRTYVIDDPAAVAAAKNLWKPMAELGREQAQLGKEQARLGQQQAELGQRQAKVSIPSADLEKTLNNLVVQLKEMKLEEKVELNQGDLVRVQERLAAVQDQLGELQSRAGDKQSEIGEQQSELGERQSELGEKQSELGERQGELAEKANRQMRSILDQSLRSGKARPVD